MGLPKKVVLIKTLLLTSTLSKKCSGDLKSEQVKRGWFANGSDFKWDLKSGSPTIWNPDKRPPLCRKPFAIQQKCPDFAWSAFQMVRNLNLIFIKSGFWLFFWISNGGISDSPVLVFFLGTAKIFKVIKVFDNQGVMLVCVRSVKFMPIQ